MYPWNKRPIKAQTPDSDEPGWDPEDLQDPCRMLRDSLYAAAERPDSYWEGRHKAIMARLEEPSSLSKRRIVEIWAPAAGMVLLCLAFFAGNSKVPASDIAAGYDQNLLIEVERALNQGYSFASASQITLEAEADSSAGSHK